LLLAATDDGKGYGIARPAKLYQTRADAARGPGDEDAIARRNPGAIEHVLAGQVGAAEGGELGIRDRRHDAMRVFGRQHHILGVAAVPAVSEVVDLGKAVALSVVDAEIDHHTLADARARHPFAHSDNAAHRVAALDARKGQRRGAAAPGRDGLR